MLPDTVGNACQCLSDCSYQQGWHQGTHLEIQIPSWILGGYSYQQVMLLRHSFGNNEKIIYFCVFVWLLLFISFYATRTVAPLVFIDFVHTSFQLIMSLMDASFTSYLGCLWRIGWSMVTLSKSPWKTLHSRKSTERTTCYVQVLHQELHTKIWKTHKYA